MSHIQLKWMVLVSLTINLVLVGWIAGRWQDSKERSPWLAQELDRSTREMVGRTLRDRRDELRVHREQVRDSLRGVRRAVVSEPLDPEALSVALAAHQSVAAEVQVDIVTALLPVLASMKPEDRLALVGSLMRLGEARHHGAPRPMHHGPPPEIAVDDSD